MKEIITKNTIKNKENKKLPIYSISNSRGFIPQEEQFDDRTVASTNLSNYTIIENGMFAYNPSRIDVGSIAYFEDHNKVIISPLYISFSCKSDYIDYLQFYLKSKKFRKNSLSFYEFSVRNTLPWDNFLEIKLPLPEKQSYKLIKILKCLIEICNYKNEEINQLQKMKKYYLNKIFC